MGEAGGRAAAHGERAGPRARLRCSLRRSTPLLLELSRKADVFCVKKGLRWLHEVGLDWKWRRKQTVKQWSEEIWGELADVEKQSNSTMAKLLETSSTS